MEQNYNNYDPTKAKRLAEELIKKITQKLKDYTKNKNAKKEMIISTQQTIDKLWELYHCCIPLTNQDVWNTINSNIKAMKEVDPEFNCLHIVLQTGLKSDKPAYINLTF